MNLPPGMRERSGGHARGGGDTGGRGHVTESTGERNGLGASRAGEPRVRVVAAVIRRAGRVLVARRPDGKRHAGLWEFPGGKIQRDETNLDAVRRELTEELRLETISVGDTLYESRDSGSPFVIRFVEVEVRGEPLALAHEELRWVEPGALTALRLAPCDTRFVVEHLLESLA